MLFHQTATAEQFLAQHWQKSAVFLPQALQAIAPEIEPDELAWLAMQPDVESRLVLTRSDGADSTCQYHVENGPFSEARLRNLPDENWTLLVQDVEKHLPKFRQWLRIASFVPDWRIDDVMISVAAVGGSVGPHADQYDVLLCQGLGTRSWRLAGAAEVEPDRSSDSLSLLQPFTDQNPHQASGGDVLYLPPGIPHWGIAESLCVTYSIGMRAPNRAELFLTAERLFPELDFDDPSPSIDPARDFYADPQLQLDEALPGYISHQAVDRFRVLKLVPSCLDHEQVAMVVGATVTDLKAWLEPDRPEHHSIDAWMESLPANAVVTVHGMARLAWYETSAARLFFVNGTCRQVNALELEFGRQLCAVRQISAGRLETTLKRDCLDAFLGWLFSARTFDTVETISDAE